jgi:hypothetical protein
MSDDAAAQTGQNRALAAKLRPRVALDSTKIGDRPTTMRVRRNKQFELCESSASSAAPRCSSAGHTIILVLLPQ